MRNMNDDLHAAYHSRRIQIKIHTAPLEGEDKSVSMHPESLPHSGQRQNVQVIRSHTNASNAGDAKDNHVRCNIMEVWSSGREINSKEL